ncbi:formate dehydrogenase [Oleomonas cavernae]|uniref:Formate dehydrogenase n=2 Tax=Oleomonas cavernae TaxID=2320859 RepID=A0A418WIV5_9PROT|nr:formate dehydrogenase [Oleomonas cavernae]
MQAEKLVYMANQIAAFFKAQGEAKAPAGIADHMAKFWDPRMRKAILAHEATGGEGLDPLALKALDLLKPKQA